MGCVNTTRMTMRRPDVDSHPLAATATPGSFARKVSRRELAARCGPLCQVDHPGTGSETMYRPPAGLPAAPARLANDTTASVIKMTTATRWRLGRTPRWGDTVKRRDRLS